MLFNTLFIFILIELMIVSFVDFKTRKVSNLWSYFHLIAFILLTLFNIQNDLFSWNDLSIPFVFFIAGYILFYFNIMGAGDVKFISTLLLVLNRREQLDFIYYLALATVLVGGILFLKNILKNREKIFIFIGIRDKKILENVFGKKFPFIPLVLMAWIGLGCLRLKLF